MSSKNYASMWQNLPLGERPRVDTLLARWLKARGMSRAAFAREACITKNRVTEFASGKRVPSLLSALRIEHATDGEVPCASWLSLPALRTQWEQMPRRAQEGRAQYDSIHKKANRIGQTRRNRARRLAEDPLLKLDDPYAETT